MKTRHQKPDPTYNYQFKKDQILGQSEKGKPILYKVVEDMKTNDHRSQLRVLKLEQQLKSKDGKVTYKEAEEILLPVKEKIKIVEDVEVKSTKPNPRSKATVTFFTFPQETLQEIAKSVQQVPANTKQQKKQVSSESEDEEPEPPKKISVKKGVKQEVPTQPRRSSRKPKSVERDEEDDEQEEEEQPKQKVTKTKVTKPTQPAKATKTTKQKEESQAEEEDDEENEESEASQPIVKGRPQRVKKAPPKQQEEEEDEEENEESEASQPKGKGKGRPQKVQKAPAKRRGRQTKEEEDEEELSQVDQSQMSQSVDSKAKKGKGSTRKSKSQPQQLTKFVKGKVNPNYRQLKDISDQLEGSNSKFHDYSSVVMNNKELIRAAKTGNKKLMEDIFKNSLKISNLFERWAPERDVNAIELIFERQDKAMLQTLIKAIGKIKLGVTPRCSLKEINTGFNDKYAYGCRTRKVALGRGGREGNNAFVYDLNSNNTLDQGQIERLMKIETDPEFFGILMSQFGNEHQYFELIASAVRCGNWRTAGYLVQMAQDKGSFYGFNQVHVDVLNYTSASRIGNIKKPSATKKTTGQYLITPIHCAAINPNHSCLQKLIDISQEFNILDELHRKPVHYAAVSSTDACLKYLLENSVDAREGDRNKTTPLMLAAQWGRTHNVELLAANNIDGKNREGNAAIHLACQNGQLETVKCLLKHGANMNLAGQNRMTPISIASAYGHVELVKFLLEKGAKLLLRDKYGRSPCAMAARNGNVQILSLLLYHGAEYNVPDSSKNTPLHYAAAYGFPECIDELMKAGADQNLPNSWKLTPLSVALQKNHLGVVKTLLNYPSTDVNCKDDEGRTLISSSLSSFTADSFEYMKYLILEKNADVKIPDLQERTPLHYAVQITRKNAKSYYAKWQELPKAERKDIKNNYETLITELIELLINAGADVNVPDVNGQTSFFQALISQNFKTAEQLMQLTTPKVDTIDTKDRNIIHKLIECKLFTNVKGYQILEDIIKQLPPEYVNQYDENGWNPLLYLISEYTKLAESQHDRIYNKKVAQLQNKLYEQQLAQLPQDDKKIDEEQQPNQEEQENEEHGEEEEEEGGSEEYDNEENEEEEEEIPIRKKTMFKNPKLVAMRTPAAATSYPASFIQPAKAGFGGKGLFGTQALNTGSFGVHIQRGGLFGQQQNQIQTSAAVEPDNNIQFHSRTFYYNSKPIIVHLTRNQVLAIKQETVQASYLLQETVLKLFQQLVNLGAQSDQVVIKRKKFRELVDKDNKEDPYVGEGNYSIAHFLFQKFHSVSFLKGLQRISTISLNEKTHKSIYPIHLFAGACSKSPVCGREDETSETFLKYVIGSVDIKVKDHNYNTPTSILATRFYKGLEEFIELLLQNGGNIDNLNKSNEVPLQKWVKNNDINVVQLFLTNFKANPNFIDKQKRTALHHAINSSNSQADASFEMEHLLILNGANTGALDYLKRTPLFYAFTKINKPNEFTEIDPFETVSSILADKNCQVDCVDIYERSPLHYAALRGSVISGRYMIKMKAPVDVPDKYGNTPLALAFISGHSNFCTMLIDNKADVNRNAIVIDVEKQRQEQKKLREEQIARGEVIETENESGDLNEQENEENEDYEEEEEEEDNALYGGARTKQTARKTTGGKFPSKAFGVGGGLFGQQQLNEISQPTKFPPGTYSYFKLAIKQGWQGVAYLLITDGYDLQRAIEDAMMEDQFKLVRTLLMKVKEDSVIQKCNDKKQNLFHIFAIKGKSCATDITALIADELTRRGVDKTALDDSDNTPLHYACQYGFYQIIKYLLHNHCDPNLFNKNQNTPFTIRLQSNYNDVINPTEILLWTSSNTNLNVKFKLFKKPDILTPFLYLIQEFHLEDEIVLQKFVDAGCDINESTQAGETSLILAIKINSLRLVNFILTHVKFNINAHAIDSSNRSPIHHVVQPLEFGSYENTDMLDVLASKFDVNQVDNKGLTPLDYAKDQDSGVMAEALKKYKATSSKKSKQPRLPTSIISQAQWVEEEIDVEADAQKFLDQNGEQLDDTKQDPTRAVDQYAINQGKVEVYIDKDIGPYSLLMTKVDVGNGIYSENVFYKMQVLHELNRNVFILFTRWGRIGTYGQYQQTPFENAEEATKEFNKIFHNKSGGNDWRKIQSGEEDFAKKPGKYQLMNVKKHKNYKTLLAPFDFSKNSPYPPCQLDQTIKRFILQFVQVRLYQRDLEQFHVDLDFLPIERLDRKQLEVAKAILNELIDLVQELVALRQKSDMDIKKIFNLLNEIGEKSSRFYEMIPMKELRTEPLPPLDSLELVNQKLLLVETLLNFEITSKILLGAHLNKLALNPLTYCFNALNVRVVTLPKEHPEFKLIAQYIKSSQEPTISNIFAIERRGEAERFEINKQHTRYLLWHGSKISNFMGILSQGLKVAPPWVMNTGSMFGKGIYFADMFAKSYGYTQDWTLYYNAYNGLFTAQQPWQRQQQLQKDEQEEIQRYRYMLLCEVAVGKSQELYQAEFVTQLPKQYQSVKGLGKRGPDYQQSIVLANGCKVPVGQCIDYPEPKKKDKNGHPVYYQLQHNEYIVYDESKVRVRYMVQLDTKNTVDEY